MIKKGFEWLRVHPPLLYSRGFGIEEPMCCEVCKGCARVGKLVCKYRKATYAEARIDRLSKVLEKSEKLKGGEKMIKKGCDFFFPVVCWTVWNEEIKCCKVCKFPFKRVCKHICKYRNASLKEAYNDIFKRGDQK